MMSAMFGTQTVLIHAPAAGMKIFAKESRHIHIIIMYALVNLSFNAVHVQLCECTHIQ